MSGLPKLVLLWTDLAVWFMALGLLGYALHARRRPDLRQKWRRVFQDRGAMGSAVVLSACLLLTLLDSVHFRPVLPPVAGQGGLPPPSSQASQASPTSEPVAYDIKTRSVLDAVLWKLAA